MDDKKTYPPLTAYRVHRDNGTSYVTNCSAETTLKDAKAYFIGQRHYLDEKETKFCTAVNVTIVHADETELDGDERLKRIRESIAEANKIGPGWNDHWDAAFGRLTELFHYLKAGLPAPKVDDACWIAMGDGERHSYSLLSNGKRNGGGGTFARWTFSKDTGMMEEDYKYKCPAA